MQDCFFLIYEWNVYGFTCAKKITQNKIIIIIKKKKKTRCTIIKTFFQRSTTTQILSVGLVAWDRMTGNEVVTKWAELEFFFSVFFFFLNHFKILGWGKMVERERERETINYNCRR